MPMPSKAVPASERPLIGGYGPGSVAKGTTAQPTILPNSIRHDPYAVAPPEVGVGHRHQCWLSYQNMPLRS